MPRTPDRTPGEADEEGIIWEEQSAEPSQDRQVYFVQNKGLMFYADGIARPIGETREAVWQTEVDDVSVNTPPGSPDAGDRVIIGSSPTGDFVGHAGEIAQYNGSSWVFTTPREGMSAYVKAENDIYKQTAAGTPWLWETGTGGGGITEAQHKALRQLIHFISHGPADGYASGAYEETMGTVFPSSKIWWESSLKLQKIVERNFTWTGVNLTTDEWKMYDEDGTTLLVTISDAISYSGIFETSRTRTITVH